MRNAFGFLFGNWFARSYLLLVAVVAVVVFVVLEVGGEDVKSLRRMADPGHASGFTARLSGAGLASGRLSTVIFFGVLAISALINAAVISLVVHTVRRLIRSRGHGTLEPPQRATTPSQLSVSTAVMKDVRFSASQPSVSTVVMEDVI